MEQNQRERKVGIGPNLCHRVKVHKVYHIRIYFIVMHACLYSYYNSGLNPENACS